ncbi:MAG: DUF899 domain-containing protein [Xanthobacteraceae bacterium]
MTSHPVVSAAEWRNARKQLMEKEKAFTRERDQLAAERRELPWVKVEKNYVFDSNGGKRSLGDLFGSRRQLIVFHFMFNPEWNAGCKSCSFWADNFNSIIVHLNERDVSMVAISRAPLSKLNAFKQRMGWNFEWLSSNSNSFNQDFEVSFSPDDLKSDAPNYNFGTRKFNGEDAPGLSVFYKDSDGTIYRTYSCYARGLDMLNGAYHFLDVTPKGRDEKALNYPMAWVKLHDEYARQ